MIVDSQELSHSSNRPLFSANGITTILHTESSTGWGGQEIRILREAIGMRERGYRVVMAVVKGGKLVQKARQENFEVLEVSFSKAKAIPTLYALCRFIKLHKVNIVNTHSSLDAWIGGIAARLKGCSIIRTRHLSTPTRGGINSRLIYRTLADYVVTTSSSIIPRICKEAGISSDRCQCIATGVKPEELEITDVEKQLFRRQIGVGKEDFLVGTLCVVRSWKGVGDFIRAAAYLKTCENLKWVIVGGGYLDEYRKLVKELGLQSKVIFTGHLENPYAALASFDLFLLLSTKDEGISQASLQAGYLKKPLVTTPIGGLPEVCLDQITGVIVPPFSPTEVAAAVTKFMENQGLCTQMGEHAHKHVLEKFTHQSMLDKMEKAYKFF